MTEPLDAIMAIHNAFRADMSMIDAAALGSARGKAGLAATVERFRFFNEVLVWHAHGEELAIFPAVEAVAPFGGRSLREGSPRAGCGIRDPAGGSIRTRRIGNGARNSRIQIPSRHTPGKGRRPPVPHRQGAHIIARPGQGSRSDVEHGAAGAFSGSDRLDVPLDRQ